MTAAVESVSQGYADKFGIERTDHWFILKLQEEVGELVQAYMNLAGMGRERGLSDPEKQQALENESADVLAHVLLLAKNHHIDLQAAVEHKWLSRAESR